VLLGLKRSIGQSAQVTRGAHRLERYMSDAQEAEGRGDFIGAANSLRLALTLVPDSEDLRKRYEEANKKVAAELADSYAKQAEYEESNQLWSEAALSWARVAEGRPDEPDPHRRAAMALVKAGADLRRARELAQTAVDLKPDQPLSRRVLGEVYLAAGLKLNARRELEAAAKLDPKDEIVKNLLRELKE
jgi:tetratricopeptide (TPR) repeat protein